MRTAILGLLLFATAVGGFYVHFEARRRRPVLVFTAWFDVVVGALAAVAVFQSATFERWMQEDAWAEWATVFAFGIAAVLLTRRVAQLWREGDKSTLLPRAGLAAVALFCVFVAGEEISWGQRLLAFEPPEVFLQENYQQEANLHNLLKDKTLLGFPLDSRFLVAVIAVVYGLVLPALVRWKKLGFFQPTIDAVAPPWELAPWFAAVAAVELAYPVDLAGEACELVLGLLFLAAAAIVGPPSRLEVLPPKAAWTLVATLTAPLGIGLAAAPIITTLVYGADEELVAQTRAELEQLRGDLINADAVQPKLLKKRRVHKRLYTAVQAKYFAPSESVYLEGRSTPAVENAVEPRRDRKGYFLDPWNNPYWVLTTKKGRRGVLYSFGPNRRRDTKMPKRKIPRALSAGGDDVIVQFDLPKVAPEGQAESSGQ